jgi:acyl phosphate:glycerol-3-phosphate acyltransferase
MLITPITVLAIIVAYLLGSIPTAVWVGKHFYKIDVRDYGSGNAGATNTFRVLGKKAGIPVLLIDVLKGWLAVMLVYVFTEPGQNSDELFHLQLRLGAAALIGHIFPIWAGFRGGKGVATLLGIIIALNLQAALLSMAVFLLVLMLTRYVSLSSMIASLAFPVGVMLIIKSSTPEMVIFSLLISLIVVITHQKNIERLFSKKESRVKFKKPGTNGLGEIQPDRGRKS